MIEQWWFHRMWCNNWHCLYTTHIFKLFQTFLFDHLYLFHGCYTSYFVHSPLYYTHLNKHWKDWYWKSNTQQKNLCQNGQLVLMLWVIFYQVHVFGISGISEIFLLEYLPLIPFLYACGSLFNNFQTVWKQKRREQAPLINHRQKEGLSGKRSELAGLCTIQLERNLWSKQPCCFSGCQTQQLKEGTCGGQIMPLPADPQYREVRESARPATQMTRLSVPTTELLTGLANSWPQDFKPFDSQWTGSTGISLQQY